MEENKLMSSKRFRYLLAVLAAFALVVAACGGGSSTTTAAPGATTTAAPGTTAANATTTTAATPTTTAAPGGELGTVEVAAGEAIQIRSLEAITGSVSFLGIPNQRGSELAIADYGQVQGHDVDLGTPLDDLCSADGGQSAGQTIVADTQVVGVIGTSCSGAAVAAAPLISAAGMVMISPSNTSPALTSDLQGNPGTDFNVGYYRTAHNDLFQGAAAAKFVYENLGLTVAAAIHDGDPYTNGLATAFKNAFEKLGGTVSVFTAVNKGDTDMTGVLSEVAAGSPQLIFFPIFQPEGDYIVQQVGSVAGLEDVVLMAADGLLVSDFLGLPESNGMYFSGPNTQFGDNASVTGETSADFLADYQAAYGEAPSAPFWAHSYDATILLLSAIDAVAVDNGDGSLSVDRQALRDELYSTTDFAGIIGSLTCDEFGDCGSQEITVVLNEGDPDAAPNNVQFSANRGDLIDLISG
jgi:branched-chain amino acid transport system substrate-binding protein